MVARKRSAKQTRTRAPRALVVQPRIMHAFNAVDHPLQHEYWMNSACGYKVSTGGRSAAVCSCVPGDPTERGAAGGSALSLLESVPVAADMRECVLFVPEWGTYVVRHVRESVAHHAGVETIGAGASCENKCRHGGRLRIGPRGTRRDNGRTFRSRRAPRPWTPRTPTAHGEKPTGEERTNQSKQQFKTSTSAAIRAGAVDP